MQIRPIRTKVFREDEDLVAFVRAHVKKIPEDSVLVVTSKIVALAEGRTAIRKHVRTKDELIKKESQVALPTKYAWLTIKDGMVVASAGIDESNADGKFILLPKDSYRSATLLRKKLRKIYKVKNLGILITDSRTIPLRAGAVGMAVGYAGFKAIKDYRGTPDIFGRAFHYSRANIADGMAAAAVLVMGEGKERYPLALINGAPITFSEKTNKKELSIPLADDMYLPFLAGLLNKNKK